MNATVPGEEIKSWSTWNTSCFEALEADREGYIQGWALPAHRLADRLPSSSRNTGKCFQKLCVTPGILSENNKDYGLFFMTALVAQMIKQQPTMWETWLQSLGQEDLLEEEMATHSSILAWKIPWSLSVGSQRVRHNWANSLSLSRSFFNAASINISLVWWYFTYSPRAKVKHLFFPPDLVLRLFIYFPKNLASLEAHVIRGRMSKTHKSFK